MGSFKKYVTCIMTFFSPFNFVTLCRFYFITSPVLFTKFYKEIIEWEKRRFFFSYMAASSYHVILKEVENHIFRPQFLDAPLYINNPYWQSSGIIIFLCKYDIVISDILAGYFLDVLFFLLTVISGLHEKPRWKDWATEKKYIEESVWVTSLFWLHALLSMSFSVASFVSSRPPFQVRHLLNSPYKGT